MADEVIYVRQARLFVFGMTDLPKVDPFSGEVQRVEVSAYPVGTAVSQMPFVHVAGWQGAFAASGLAVLLGVLGTALWLAQVGRSPLFALLVLAFPATTVMGRVAMSDAPSLALTAFGLFCFARGAGGPRGWWWASGFIAGASLCFRETNPLIFAPFFAGALLRRERGSGALLAAGILGAALRPLSSWWVYGDPLFTKPVESFGLAAVAANAPLHALAWSVAMPGGALAIALYRGPRRAEVVATALLLGLVYLTYGYGAVESSLPKRLVLGLRFFLPLLPVVAFASAEVTPRLYARWRARRDSGASWGRVAVVAGVAAVALQSVAVHAVHARWSADQAAIRDAIYEHTGDGSVIVTNWNATGKFIDLLYGPRSPLPRERITPAHVDALLRRHGEIFVVLLDRTDTPYWQRDARANADFAASLGPAARLQLDRAMTATDRLRVWRVGR